MKVQCPCGTQLNVPDDLVGKKVRCPSCQAVITAEPAGNVSIQPAENVPPPSPQPSASGIVGDRDRPSRGADADDRPRSQGRDDADDRGRPRRDDVDDRPQRRPDDDRDRGEDNGRPKPTSGKAIASLVCGILGFIIPCFASIAGVILGIMASSECSRRRIPGAGLATTGIILSALSLVVWIIGGPILLLIPSVQKVRDAAERTKSTNDAMQIALSFHSFHDQFRHLPPTHVENFQKGREPADLGWRVGILPFIEQMNVYNQIDQDGFQPWDSPSNKRFSNQMPFTYQATWHPVPDINQTHSHTRWQVFTGPGTLYPDDNKATFTLGNIPRGTSNLILFGEAATPVPWMKPADMAIRPGQPIPLLPDLIIVGLANGSVRTIDRRRLSDQVLREFIDPANVNPPAPEW